MRAVFAPIFPVPMIPAVRAVDFKSQKPLKRKVSFADTVICKMDFAVKREDQRNGVFGHTMAANIPETRATVIPASPQALRSTL